jgi:hypothetical protein
MLNTMVAMLVFYYFAAAFLTFAARFIFFNFFLPMLSNTFKLKTQQIKMHWTLYALFNEVNIVFILIT